MTPRKLRASDIPILKAMERGFPYPDPLDPMIESFIVIADETDAPVAAFCGRRICEVYGWVSPTLPTPAKMRALRIAHGCLGALRARGYTHVEVFLAPAVRSLGARLARSFGWARNWESWTRGL